MLGTGMLLARLLTPTDFGVYAMVATLTALVESVAGFGFGLGPALVRARDWPADRERRVTRVLVIASGGLAVFVMAAAAPLSWFYGEPRVIPVTLAVALGVFCIGLPGVWQARLVRHLRFGPIAFAETAALVLSVAVALGLAARGAGYWALVWQYVTFSATRALLLAIGDRAERRREARHAAATSPARDPAEQTTLRSLIAFGWHVTLAQVVTFAGRVADRAVVGYFGGAAILGLYESAHRWSLVPFTQIMGPLHTVMLATLNRTRRRGAELGAAVSRIMLPPMSAVMPLLCFLALEARAVVRVLLGDQWDGAVPFFQVLCGAAVANSLLKLTRVVYLVTGATRRQLMFAVVHAVALVIAVLVGVRQGAMGVAWGVLVATWLLLPAAAWYCTVDTVVRPMDLWRAIARPVMAAAVAVGVVRMLAPALETEAGLIAVVMRAAWYGVVYVVIWVGIPGGRQAAAQFAGLVRDLRAGRS